jgi:hypothetical protein
MPQPADLTSPEWFYGTPDRNPVFPSSQTGFERALELLASDAAVTAKTIPTIYHLYQGSATVGGRSNLPAKVGFMRVLQRAMTRTHRNLSGHDSFDVNVAIRDVMQTFEVLKSELAAEQRKLLAMPMTPSSLLVNRPGAPAQAAAQSSAPFRGTPLLRK